MSSSSGIRLYNYTPRSINLAASPISRTGALANLYRSLCSNSGAGDHVTRSILSNIKSCDDAEKYTRVIAFRTAGIPLKQAQVLADEHVDNYTRVIDLQAAGIPLQEAQVLANKLKDLPKWKFDDFLKSIRLDRSLEIENARLGRPPEIENAGSGLRTLLIGCGLGAVMCFYDYMRERRKRMRENE